MNVRSISVLAASAVIGAGAVCSAGIRPRDDAKADPAAYSLLKEAHDKRSVFPANFGGISADLEINDNGTTARGTMSYSAAGEFKVALNGASKQQEDWAKEQLGSAFSHRKADDFAKADGKYALSLGPEDHSPLGRLVNLNDRMKSFNRVKDGQITEVTRSMGNMKFTITVMENKIVDGGRYLPNQFAVTYFDSSGAITRSDLYSDQFAKVGDAWVPSGRRVVTAENGGFATRTFALTNIRSLNGRAASR